MSTTTDTQMSQAQHYAAAESLLQDAQDVIGAPADRFVAMAQVHATLATTPRPHDLQYGRGL